MKKGEDYTGVSVVFMCHDGNNNYLFAKRSVNCRDEQGKWDFGAGGLEFGNSVEETLRREIKEEYCADVLNFEFLGYRDVHRENDGKRTHWVALDFKVLIDPKQARIGEAHKFDDIGWFSILSLPAPIHSQIPNFVEKYRSRL